MPGLSNLDRSADLPSRHQLEQEFVNHANQTILREFFGGKIYYDLLYSNLTVRAANVTGTDWQFGKSLSYFVADDFSKCCRVIEECYQVLLERADHSAVGECDRLVNSLLEQFPKLNLMWQKGHFVPRREV